MQMKDKYTLPSRLYCRHRNRTGSYLSARGVYRRSGISPCPEFYHIYYISLHAEYKHNAYRKCFSISPEDFTVSAHLASAAS